MGEGLKHRQNSELADHIDMTLFDVHTNLDAFFMELIWWT